MGDNIDQNANAFMEQLQQLPLHLQAWSQQQQAPASPTLGDANRSYMFYRDHQNLYYQEDYVEEPMDHVYHHEFNSYTDQNFQYFEEEPAYHGYEQGYQDQEWQWQYQDPYQPPQPQYQEQYQLERDDSQDDLKETLQQLLAHSQKSGTRLDEIATNLDALTSHIHKLDTQIAWNAEAIENWSENLNVITPESDTQMLSHEQTPTKVPKVMDLDDSNEFSDLGKFDHAGNKDEQISSPMIVVLSDQSIPEPTQISIQFFYIPKVGYPAIVYRLKILAPPKETPMASPTERDNKPVVLENLFSFVVFYSDVMLWSAEPTRHTMPWFEEIVIYLASKPLDELSRA